MQFIQPILVSALALSLFFSVLIMTKQKRNLADVILFGWMLVIAYHIGAYLSSFGTPPGHDWIIELSGAWVLIHGPIMLFYIHAIYEQSAPPTTLYLHLIPLGLNLMLLPILVVYDWYGLDISLGILKVISCLLYPFLAISKLKSYEVQMQALVSDAESKRMIWFRMVAMGIGMIAIVATVSLLLTEWGGVHIQLDGELFIAIALSCFVMVIGFFGFRQTSHFVDVLTYTAPINPVPAQPPQMDPPSKSVETKYAKTGLDAEASKQKFGELLAWMQSDQPFLDPELTLLKLAEKADIPAHQLSQIINQNTDQNFFAFINQYRVQAVIEAIQKGEHTQHTLLSIALAAGFNSKASFNRAFKQLSGVSPSAYIKQHDP